MLQVESHPFFHNARLIEHAASAGLAVTAYSPLGSGGTSKEGHTIFSHPTLAAIANRHDASAAEVTEGQAAVGEEEEEGVEASLAPS